MKRGQPVALVPFGVLVHGQDRRRGVTGQRGLRGFGVAIHADHDALTSRDVAHARALAGDEPLLDEVERGDHPAEVQHALDLGPGRVLDLTGFRFDDRTALENVAVFQQVGLVGENLLNAQAPLLIPRPRQAQGFVPRRELHGPAPGVLAERHPQRFQHDARNVVLRLGLGQAERVDLHAVAKAALPRVGDAVAVARDRVPQPAESAQLARLFDEPQSGVDEEADPADRGAERLVVEPAGVAHRIEHGERRAQRVCHFLHGRGSRFLQMVGADVDRVPLRDVGDGVGDDVGRQPQARFGREDVRPARQIFLDDVVLRRALQGRRRHPAALGHGDVQRQQPRCGGVDRHGRVHAVERNVGEQRLHVADVANRHADLADLARGLGMVAVVAGLRRQIEGDRQAGLALAQIETVELVTLPGGRMPGVGAHDPRARLRHLMSSFVIPSVFGEGSSSGLGVVAGFNWQGIHSSVSRRAASVPKCRSR